jgi:hypothetical protein
MKPPPSPGSGPRQRIVRTVARCAFVVAAIAAIWLLAPASASADEGPLDLTVDATVDEVVGSTEDTATSVVDQTDDAAESAASSGSPDGPALGSVAAGQREPTGDATDPVALGLETVGGLLTPPTTGRANIFVPNLETASTNSSELVPAPDPSETFVEFGDAPASPDVPTQAAAIGGFSARELAAESSAAPGSADPLRPRPRMHDLAAFLILMTLLIGFGRWSRREAEKRLSPLFLSLAERPG